MPEAITDDRIVVITGAAAGLGRAIARTFAADGFKLMLCDIAGDRVAATAEELRRTGADAHCQRTDVTSEQEVEALVAGTIEKFGRVDVLINNAGVMDHDRGVGELAVDDWHRVIAINLTGPMLTMRAAIPRMISAGGGQVINIGSTAALRGGAAGAAYTVAKHGLIGLTRSTAWLYAATGIVCNVVAPGGMNTGMTMPERGPGETDTDRALAAVRAIIPDSLEPEMVATTVLYVAGMARNGLNGAIIPVDAGWTAG